MAYSATKNAQGNYQIYKDGSLISTGSAAVLPNYGLSETQLTSAAPATSPTPTVTPTPAVSAPTNTSVQPSQQPVVPKIALPTAVYTTYQNQIKNGQITPQAAAAALQNIYNTGLYTDSFDPSKLYTAGLTYTDANGNQVAFDNTGTGNTIKTAATVQNNVVTGAGTSTYSGPSVVDYLSSVNQPNDFASRAKLAVQYGLVTDPTQYTGSAQQNTALLTALKTHAAGATASQAGQIAGSTATPTSTGLPGDLSSILGLSAPTTNSPIPSSALGTTNPSLLANLLGVGAANGASNNDSINSLMAGLNTPPPEDAAYTDLTKQLTDAMSSLGGESGDLTSALSANGVPQAQSALASLNTDIAAKKGALDQFDAQTQAAVSGAEDQAIPAGLVQGQQAAIQKQRNLTKMAMAADLSASVALATAYQGNIDTGIKLAQQSVDMKYAPIENEITTLQTQISLAKDAMDKADSKQANIINTLLTIQSNQISEQKTNEKAIMTQAVNAAANGAPLSVVTAMQNATDPAHAAVIGSTWLKGNGESVGSSGATGGSSSTGSGSTKSTFTQTQLNGGAGVAGLAINDFTALPSSVQNYFINSPGAKSFMSDISAMGLDPDDPKYMSADDITSNINASVMPADVKTYLTNLVNEHKPAAKSGGSGGGIGNFFGGIWNTIKTGASDLVNRI